MCKSPSRQLVQSKEHTLLLDCCFFCDGEVTVTGAWRVKGDRKVRWFHPLLPGFRVAGVGICRRQEFACSVLSWWSNGERWWMSKAFKTDLGGMRRCSRENWFWNVFIALGNPDKHQSKEHSVHGPEFGCKMTKLWNGWIHRIQNKSYRKNPKDLPGKNREANKSQINPPNKASQSGWCTRTRRSEWSLGTFAPETWHGLRRGCSSSWANT